MRLSRSPIREGRETRGCHASGRLAQRGEPRLRSTSARRPGAPTILGSGGRRPKRAAASAGAHTGRLPAAPSAQAGRGPRAGRPAAGPALVVAVLISGASGWTQEPEWQSPPQPSSEDEVVFEGTLTGMDDGCLTDGLCTITVDEKLTILTEIGGRRAPTKEPRGQLIGISFGLTGTTDARGYLGRQVEVYARKVDKPRTPYHLTLYGSPAYYVKLLPDPFAGACPEEEWINCMPGPDPINPRCDPDYLEWAKQQCPGFQGTAY